jgi:mono/diheme cytochrome c family protein
MSKRIVFALFTTVCLVAFSGYAAAQDAKAVAKGEALAVKNHCSMCHLINGKGGKIGKPLDGVSERFDAAALKRILIDPDKEFPNQKVKMPKVAWGSGDVDALVAYMQTLKAPGK